jgi:regulator of replication initiation timing
LESQCKSLKDIVSEKEAEIKYVKRDREDYLKDKLNLALENKRLQNELDREKRANTSRMITDEDKIDNGRSLTLPDELSTGTSQLTTPRGNNMAG